MSEASEEEEEVMQSSMPSNQQDEYEDDGDDAIHATAASTAVGSFLVTGVVHTFEHKRILLAGQLLSFLLSVTGAASATLHMNCNLSAPAFQSLLLYVLLSFHVLELPPFSTRIRSFWRQHKQRRSQIIGRDQPEDAINNDAGLEHDIEEEEDRASMNENQMAAPYLLLYTVPMYAPIWVYVIIAFLDVQANYLTYLSFRYTTFTSIALFDALAIPASMVFSRIALKRNYVGVHVLGAIVCMIGVAVNVLSDYKKDLDDAALKESAMYDDTIEIDKEATEYPQKVLGDCLAIMGGILYGVNDVLAEMSIKTFGGRAEFLSLLGIFGTLISALQVLALEEKDVYRFFHRSDLLVDDTTYTVDDAAMDMPTCSKAAGFWLLAAYVLANYVSYVGVAYFLAFSEAALLNLSLLTGDLWAVVFTVFASHIIPPPLFWVALTTIMSGVFIYEIGPSPLQDPNEHHRTRSILNDLALSSEHSPKHARLDQESGEDSVTSLEMSESRPRDEFNML
eukprot:CAMPEP_0198290738 /NCGR_PEP_ID=MMETSP1449-20131203/8497_1 /TAXON_ID=420275 /ORGANISM="Attheya septentrionalis, Strain CCMP2084" /LENGTH=507 /DNA_ID=CAMNT_0043989283 /DNA_START=103 /DNA_END=1626 /DNA_ORIENTATION=-